MGIDPGRVLTGVDYIDHAGLQGLARGRGFSKVGTMPNPGVSRRLLSTRLTEPQKQNLAAPTRGCSQTARNMLLTSVPKTFPLRASTNLPSISSCSSIQTRLSFCLALTSTHDALSPAKSRDKAQA